MISMVQRRSPVSIERQCQMLQLPRCSYYRSQEQAPERTAEEQRFIDALYRECLKHRNYGYRRICVELRKTFGNVNRKRVQQRMRQEGLSVVPHRRFIHTTDSKHGYLIYENLTRGIALTGINQLWVSDITYIDYGGRFAYLAVILDAKSRKIIGWKLSKHVDSNLTLDALRMALSTRPIPEGLIHHSDRGVQYANHAYTDLLKDYNIRISMSAKGNPYDNAKAESFMKTIKYEEVYQNEYRTFDDVSEAVERYIHYYNTSRIHSSIDYLAPVEYEQQPNKSITTRASVPTKSSVSI